MAFIKVFINALKAGFGAISVFLMMSLFPGKLKERAKKLEKEGLVIEKEDSKMEFGWQMLKGLFTTFYNQSFHVTDGDDVPSHIDLIDMDTKSKMNLRSLCKSNVPLVLNFGSCT